MLISRVLVIQDAKFKILNIATAPAVPKIWFVQKFQMFRVLGVAVFLDTFFILFSPFFVFVVCKARCRIGSSASVRKGRDARWQAFCPGTSI